MVKKAYSVEIKLACIEMKKAGKSNKIIKETLRIKNDSQIYTWMRWYENDELHRFHQAVGKQYTYGKGMEELSEVEQLQLQVEFLKKYRNLVRQPTK
ncbi:putative iSSag7, transposase OrfA [Streptococcus mutans]|nr:putative iSSag7, transposase OrfA [Streptococcus mutans]